MNPSDFWGQSVLERPIIHYTRRRDRVLALFSPRKRRALKMMQFLADKDAIKLQQLLNEALTAQIYGTSFVKIDKET